jgi:hypothetical protein
MLFRQLREFLAEIFALLRRYLGGLKSRKSALWAEMNQDYAQQAKS